METKNINNIMKSEFLKSTNLRTVFKTTLDDVRYNIYQSTDFKGYKVTAGVAFISIEDGENVLTSAKFKATICSKEDSFNADQGINMILGRLIRESSVDFTISVPYEEVDGSSDFGGCGDFMVNFVERKIQRVADYIENRKDKFKILDSMESDFKQALRQEFSEFK